MAKIITIADVPDELADQWLMHLRVFDRMNPGCHFHVVAGVAQAIAEVRALIKNLDLDEIAVYERVMQGREKKGH